MKILHVLTQKPSSTGSGIYLRALLNQAPLLGHQTAVVCAQQADDCVELNNSFTLQFQSTNLPFPIVGMSDVMPYQSTRWCDMTESMLARYIAEFQMLLQKAVSNFQPDVVHCHHLWVLTALVRKLFPTLRVVASCHGTGLRQQSKIPKLAESIKSDLDRVDHIYCLTEDQADILASLTAAKTVVGAGFDSEIFHSTGVTRDDNFRILFAGKLSASKGCLELLKAIEPLLQENVSLSLAGSGHGEESDLITQRAEQLGVNLLGRLSQRELADEMRRSNVFVLPSYYEGLPLVLAEALSCGCRVVVTGLPGVSQWLPQGLLNAGWVKTVPLPRLMQVDQPVAEDLPLFVEHLRQALQEQIFHQPTQPKELKSFLDGNSWRGVYQKISADYSTGATW